MPGKLSFEPLPFGGRFRVAGSIWALSTNSQDILTAFGRSFVAVEDLTPHPDLSVRLSVETDIDTVRWRQPYFRALDHLFFAKYGPRDAMLIDQLRKRVIGALSSGTAKDLKYWRRVVFPTLLGIVSASVGVTPVHCACLARDGLGLLICGPSGVGKSTLAVFLSMAGFSYVTDDCVYVSRSPSGLLAWGLPTAIKLLPDSTRYFRRLRNRVPEISLNGELALETDPATTFGIRHSPCCKPHWLVFLERNGQKSAAFRKVSSQEAALRLTSELEMLPTSIAHQRQRQLATIRDLTAQKCWVLKHGLAPRSAAEHLAEFCSG